MSGVEAVIAAIGLIINYDRWLYAFKNLHKLNQRPAAFRARVFERLFEIAEIAKFKEKEKIMYQESLRKYYDWEAARETAVQEGAEKGVKKKMKEIAILSFEEGLSDEVLNRITGVSLAQLATWRAAWEAGKA